MQSGQIYYVRCFRCHCYCVTTHNKDTNTVCISPAKSLACRFSPHSHFERVNVHSVALLFVLLPANKEIKFDAIDSPISCGDAVVKFGPVPFT